MVSKKDDASCEPKHRQKYKEATPATAKAETLVA